MGRGTRSQRISAGRRPGAKPVALSPATSVEYSPANNTRRRGGGRWGKNRLKPWKVASWCTAQVGADFVARMDDVLDLYAQAATAPDPTRPLGCFDERPMALHADVHPGRPGAPGEPARVDDEYVRQGTCCCLLAFKPLDGWRHVTVSATRTNADCAHARRHRADACYPDATPIRVVLDNLSTHTAAALYQTFAPAEARRLAQKLACHYTPTHASWLNMAELELAVLTRQCLARRLATQADVAREGAAWQHGRNHAAAGVTWRFTTADARATLARLYPQLA